MSYEYDVSMLQKGRLVDYNFDEKSLCTLRHCQLRGPPRGRRFSGVYQGLRDCRWRTRTDTFRRDCVYSKLFAMPCHVVNRHPASLVMKGPRFESARRLRRQAARLRAIPRAPPRLRTPDVGLALPRDQRGTRPGCDPVLDRTARLEHDLERDDHATDDEPGKDSYHNRTAWQTCQSCSQTCPKRE